MWVQIVLTSVFMLALLLVAALVVAAVRVIRREEAAEWVGSPTLNGSPGNGRRSGKLRRAA